MVSRQLIQQTTGTAATEGDGIEITRLIGTGDVDMIDPFLLMDEFKSSNAQDDSAGFPDHPHRGFETITYLLAGRMRHQDSAGHAGTLEAGGVQWMTTGKGVIHSETPVHQAGALHGLQFWLNLPKSEKMREPEYQDFSGAELIEINSPDYTVKVIIGEIEDKTVSPANTRQTEPLIIDIKLSKNSVFQQQTPITHNVFLYVIEGEVQVGTEHKGLPPHTLGILSSGDIIEIRSTNAPSHFLLIAGKPLNEPVARGGPFVMNTREEIMQAFKDYQTGQF